MNKKLGVIVPYRNRHEHNQFFLPEITKYLKKRKINYEIIIVNQDDAKLFNRGMLLNIGFKIAQSLKCDYVVFHDIDMIPHRVDYGYSENAVHLATDFILNDGEKEREIFNQYFGGVTLFPMDKFIKIDGFSNKYWGWGYEDDDLLYRCMKHNVGLDTVLIKNMGKPTKALKFNGINAYVKGKRNFTLNKNITIFVSFYPDEIIFDHTKDVDNYSVFSMPGYDTAITYNSFHRYNFCTFEEVSKNALYVNSQIKPKYKTNVCIKINVIDKKIDVFQDGIKIGDVTSFEKLIKQRDSFFYLGAGNPKRLDNENFFKGYIDKFMVFDGVLTDEEIFNLSEDEEIDSLPLKVCYDANHIENYKLKDLSGNDNDGEIFNCEIVDLNFNEYEELPIPYRRYSIFKSLKHDENGFLGNRWKDDSIRWNQLRFNNEVLKNEELIYDDGLSTLNYVEHGRTVENNVTTINVGI